jgi:Resolvase, N terminal domain
VKYATLIEAGAEVSGVGESNAFHPRHPSRLRPRRDPPSRFLADEEKSGAYGTGSWKDTSTPTGKMIFTVLGAVAELERTLIVERVKAGLRNARAKGKRLGRPRSLVDAAKTARLRSQGVPWRKIALQIGISARTARRAGQNPG